MLSTKKQKVYDLLKGIETGEPSSVAVVNEAKYIQHNPHTHEGSLGLAELFKRLSETNPKVDIVRIFEDGDYVFAHTIYDFSNVNIGFEVFRYDGGQVVEHWDNIQRREGNMVGGSTAITDLEKTEQNRAVIAEFLNHVVMKKNTNDFANHIAKDYIEHNPTIDLSQKIAQMTYQTTHRLLAEGNFVLSVNEGLKDDKATSFYDLFRLENGVIVEHWDNTETVPPKSEWKNENGKF